MEIVAVFCLVTFPIISCVNSPHHSKPVDPTPKLLSYSVPNSWVSTNVIDKHGKRGFEILG